MRDHVQYPRNLTMAEPVAQRQGVHVVALMKRLLVSQT